MNLYRRKGKTYTILLSNIKSRPGSDKTIYTYHLRERSGSELLEYFVHFPNYLIMHNRLSSQTVRTIAVKKINDWLDAGKHDVTNIYILSEDVQYKFENPTYSFPA